MRIAEPNGTPQGWHVVAARTAAPPCTTVMVAVLKATSVISAVQLLLGQPAWSQVGWAGASVRTLNVTLPFLISDAGIDWVPLRVTSAGFWPGAWVPPWL